MQQLWKFGAIDSLRLLLASMRWWSLIILHRTVSNFKNSLYIVSQFSKEMTMSILTVVCLQIFVQLIPLILENVPQVCGNLACRLLNIGIQLAQVIGQTDELIQCTDLKEREDKMFCSRMPRTTSAHLCLGNLPSNPECGTWSSRRDCSGAGLDCSSFPRFADRSCRPGRILASTRTFSISWVLRWNCVRGSCDSYLQVKLKKSGTFVKFCWFNQEILIDKEFLRQNESYLWLVNHLCGTYFYKLSESHHPTPDHKLLNTNIKYCFPRQLWRCNDFHGWRRSVTVEEFIPFHNGGSNLCDYGESYKEIGHIVLNCTIYLEENLSNSNYILPQSLRDILGSKKWSILKHLFSNPQDISYNVWCCVCLIYQSRLGYGLLIGGVFRHSFNFKVFVSF